MLREIFSLIIAFLIILLFNNPCLPEQSTISDEELKNLKKEIEALKEGQTAIQKDLQEIKNLLRARQVPRPPEFKETTLSIKDNQFKGSKDAKLVLIEFFDFQ
jgi:uncharacterized membrane protein (DUF106 family)